MDIPKCIETEAQLDEVLSRPGAKLVEAIRQITSPLVVLGAGGKMGPSLASLAVRAAEAARHKLEVIAVSRFTDAAARAWLEERGVRTISCDLLDREALKDLPDSAHVLYLVGIKFGTETNPSLTWAINALTPSHVAERYPDARLVVLSSGNVYPFTPKTRGGAVESDRTTPLGEYANAVVARERIFEFYSITRATPVVILRLNYAVELRYGVLLEIAQKVWRQEPIDLTMGYLNCIWQGDANEFILRALELAETPPATYNLTGMQVLSVRELACQFGDLLQREPILRGVEADTALLSNSAKLCRRLGEPPTTLEIVMKWVAHWVVSGGSTLGKSTHFEVRDGRY